MKTIINHILFAFSIGALVLIASWSALTWHRTNEGENEN